MNDQVRNGNSNDAVAGGAPGEAEATLRLIASLPPPQGLEERLHASLAEAPRRGRVLAWPAALNPGSAWMRSAAAAAIVSVVVGGGWGVYSRIPHAQQARRYSCAARARAGRLRDCRGHAHAANPQWTGGGASAGGPAGRGQARWQRCRADCTECAQAAEPRLLSQRRSNQDSCRPSTG